MEFHNVVITSRWRASQTQCPKECLQPQFLQWKKNWEDVRDIATEDSNSYHHDCGQPQPRLRRISARWPTLNIICQVTESLHKKQGSWITFQNKQTSIPPSAAKTTTLRTVQGMFCMGDHVLSHKTHLNSSQKIKFISNTFFDHHSLKLENNKMNHWKLRNL